MESKALYLFFYLCLSSIIILFLIHVLIVRLTIILKMRISNQKLLIYIIIFYNVPLLVISSIFLRFNNNSLLIGNIYCFLVFNAFAYVYFHFFNMSETARRIKILIGIMKSYIKRVNDINKYYNTDKILINRLKRLEELSQIREIEKNKYILKKKLLFTVSYLMNLWRYILGITNQ